MSVESTAPALSLDAQAGAVHIISFAGASAAASIRHQPRGPFCTPIRGSLSAPIDTLISAILARSARPKV